MLLVAIHGSDRAERQRMVWLLGRVHHLELDVPRLGTYELLRREIAKNKRAFAADDSGDTDYAK